jgi:hypothetical protein
MKMAGQVRSHFFSLGESGQGFFVFLLQFEKHKLKKKCLFYRLIWRWASERGTIAGLFKISPYVKVQTILILPCSPTTAHFSKPN